MSFKCKITKRGIYIMDDFGSLVLADNSAVHQLTSEFNQYE